MIMRELIIQHNLGVEEINGVASEEFASVDFSGVNPTTGYEYVLRFNSPDDSRPGGVHISTEARGDFLRKGTEEDAQSALVDLSHFVRPLTGGVFRIHPFYGAVYNTKLDTVAPGFGLCKYEQPEDSLSMSIVLSDEGYKFDRESTKEARAIGTTVVVPSPAANRMLAYMEKPKVNPNQESRDQAVTNDLGKRWDAEFRRFNGPKFRFLRTVTKRAIEVTPYSITYMLKILQNQKLFADVVVDTLRTGKPSDEHEIATLNALFDAS